MDIWVKRKLIENMPLVQVRLLLAKIHAKIQRQRRKLMAKVEVKRLKQSLTQWRKNHTDINALRKAYREKVPGWVADSMEFEKEPVDINRLKKRLKKEKIAPGL